MALLHLEALPRQTKKGTIVRLLIQVGGIDSNKIGTIELFDRRATIEIPHRWAGRLSKSLDGTRLGDQQIRARAQTNAKDHDKNDHFSRLLRLLDMEAKAEAQQVRERIRRASDKQAEEQGDSLLGMTITEEYSGLGGRMLVTFRKKQHQQRLPWTRLSVGSPVLVTEEGRDRHPGWRGVVSKRGEMGLQVALAQSPDSESTRPIWRLDIAGDEIGRRRQQGALEQVRLSEGDRLTQLRQILLNPQKTRFDEPKTFEFLDPTLNETQQEAVIHAMSARDVAIIHGPPGTGKTTTVVELIRQAVRAPGKVLACAPSNMAVDNLFQKLLAAGERVIRLGHPARVLPELRDHTLDLIVENHPDVRLARKMAREAMTLRDKADRYTRAKPAPSAKREMRQEARELIADARRLEAQVVREVLDNAEIICATNTGIDSEILGQRSFDLAIIDEACQCTEPAAWIPILRSERLVLAGDHCQLPPTVISKQAMREGFGTSLLERLIEERSSLARRLGVQYRMHQTIMDFSSGEFYEGSLKAAPSVAAHLLSDFEILSEEPFAVKPLQFIDTAGGGFDEQQEEDGQSRLNPREAELVARKVQTLLDAGLPAKDIAVISPYAAQVRRLRDLLPVDGLEIDTVDGFQGREKEAVLISLVRSNREGQIGFLSDVRRMNVALTRARRKLLVVGDSATIGGNPFYGRLLEYFETQGAYHTIWEEE